MGNDCVHTRCRRFDADCFTKRRERRGKENNDEEVGGRAFSEIPMKREMEKKVLAAVHWPYESVDGRPKVIGDDIATLKRWFVWVTKDFRGGQASGWSSRSWKTGLAFCAILAKCDPQRFDFKDLRDNCSQRERIEAAFSYAESELGVSRYLDIDIDMIDRKGDYVEGHLLKSYLAQLQPAVDAKIFERACRPPKSVVLGERTCNEKKRSKLVSEPSTPTTARMKRGSRKRSCRTGIRSLRSRCRMHSRNFFYDMKSPIAMESDSDFDDFEWTADIRCVASPTA